MLLWSSSDLVWYLNIQNIQEEDDKDSKCSTHHGSGSSFTYPQCDSRGSETNPHGWSPLDPCSSSWLTHCFPPHPALRVFTFWDILVISTCLWQPCLCMPYLVLVHTTCCVHCKIFSQALLETWEWIYGQVSLLPLTCSLTGFYFWGCWAFHRCTHSINSILGSSVPIDLVAHSYSPCLTRAHSRNPLLSCSHC